MDIFSSVGKEFPHYKVFLCEFQKFCKDKHQPFVVTTNNKKQITLHCRHGIKRTSSSAGKHQAV